MSALSLGALQLEITFFFTGGTLASLSLFAESNGVPASMPENSLNLQSMASSPQPSFDSFSRILSVFCAMLMGMW